MKYAPRSASKLIQLKDTPRIFENAQGLILEQFQIIALCLIIVNGVYMIYVSNGLANTYLQFGFVFSHWNAFT